MQDVYKKIEECSIVKKCIMSIIFDDMIADMFNNKKLNPVLTELFIRGRKLNISRCHANFYALFNYDNSK